MGYDISGSYQSSEAKLNTVALNHAIEASEYLNDTPFAEMTFEKDTNYIHGDMSAIRFQEDVEQEYYNISRAIKKGTGELEGVTYDEITYEGYGPAGIALIIETATDNRNRTVADIRHIMSRNNGSLGESGSVSWMFHRKGTLDVPVSAAGEDRLMEVLLDAGLEDLNSDDENYFTVITDIKDLENVKKALDDSKISYENAKIDLIPENYIELEAEDASKVIKLIDALESNDDVQGVYSNMDISESAMSSLND